MVPVEIEASGRREGERIDAVARLRGTRQDCRRRRERGTCGDSAIQEARARAAAGSKTENGDEVARGIKNRVEQTAGGTTEGDDPASARHVTGEKCLGGGREVGRHYPEVEQVRKQDGVRPGSRRRKVTRRKAVERMYGVSLTRQERLNGIGAGNALISDTWAWDGKVWTRIATEGPPARIQFAMGYDTLRDRIVLFGGVNNKPQRILDDLWEFDGTRWAQKQP